MIARIPPESGKQPPRPDIESPFSMPVVPNLRTYNYRPQSHGHAACRFAAQEPRRHLPDFILPTARTPTAAAATVARQHILAAESVADGGDIDQRQAYLDTPQIIYSQWNDACGGIDGKLGTLPPDFRVALIGAGMSNMVAAYELAKAGANVTVIEVESEVGGRARSLPTPDGNNIAEMGAMRFPPSEDLLFWYAQKLGYTFSGSFPDPGKVPTIVCYENSSYEWVDPSSPPPGFETVAKGWSAFVHNGITKDGAVVLDSSDTLQNLLKSTDPNERAKVIDAWQKYLDTFSSDSFYTGLQRIFGEQHEWDVPGGKSWTDVDFERFGTLGLGSGGFGPLFAIAFLTVYRLMPNGLETDQMIFAKNDGGIKKPTGIRDLAISLKDRAIGLGATFKFNTFGQPLAIAQGNYGRTAIRVEETKVGSPDSEVNTYDFVIVGTTTKAMDVCMSLADFNTAGPLFFDKKVCAAIKTVHMTSSSKLFIRTKKFWKDQDPKTFPRNILSDTKLPQLYTLDYDDPDYGMVLISYTWEDLSTQTAAYNNPKALFKILKAQIANIMSMTQYPDWTDNLVPVTEDDYYLIHWQLEDNYNGAFMLGAPGQDPNTIAMFRDFLKLSAPVDSAIEPILVNGDSAGFTGGWIEGGLQVAMNAISAVLLKYGTLEHEELSPVRLLQQNVYKYQ
ncbi:flavin-containing amine oxidoreductase-domain containing protein [Auriculariales sp. MPI-PUGE-AT-0066]|nr:flavin-containing amine oxidoreductase-domain containing protein [Auriculariales sp. MPI-PUGE-AT-0066]